MDLKTCLDLNNSDKSFKHKYDTIYEPHLAEVRNNPINLLEIGIFKGESISAWLDYFPNATIYGVDIFERVKSEDISILDNVRVRWKECDSTKHYPADWENIKFDFIIDDGLHTPEANKQTFANFSPHLSETGVYFVEDVWPLDIMTEEQLKQPWIRNKPEYELNQYTSFLETIHDYGRCKLHDLRKETRKPDSCIWEIKR